jgi:hypothetical protein
MTPIKKGMYTYLFNAYDHKSCVSVRRVYVTSMGKKQGTATHTENGQNVKYQLYADDIKDTFFTKSGFFNGCCLMAVADVPDADAKALELAVAMKQYWQDHYRNAQHGNLDASDGYHKSVSKDARNQFDTPPRVIFLGENFEQVTSPA